VQAAESQQGQKCGGKANDPQSLSNQCRRSRLGNVAGQLCSKMRMPTATRLLISSLSHLQQHFSVLQRSLWLCLPHIVRLSLVLLHLINGADPEVAADKESRQDWTVQDPNSIRLPCNACCCQSFVAYGCLSSRRHYWLLFPVIILLALIRSYSVHQTG